MGKHSFGWTVVILVGLVAMTLGAAVPVKANGNNVLAPSRTFQVQGDVTAAGVGLRSTGTGTIQLNDIPTGGAVYRAYLYWATIGNANTFTAPTLNGQPVEGVLIGTTGDTCWFAQHNFVYRADVTSVVGGNGAYTIAGLPSSLINENDSQGASLVVIYTLPGPYRSIVINDGAVALNYTTHAYTDTISGFTVDAPVSQAHVTYLIGDGQALYELGNVNFNGTTIASSVFTGTDGPYWGTHTFDVTNLVNGSPAVTTINDDNPTDPNNPDCLLWAGTIFSVTSPVQQATNDLSQSFRQTLYGDVTVTGVGLRGKGSGEIPVSSIPANAQIRRAYLYWATIGNSGSYTSPNLAGTPVNGQLIGVSADTCWGAFRNYTYRADVTSLVTGNGNYTISGLPGDLQTGNDTQGAGLVIVYSSGGLFRTIIINDGAVTLDLSTNSYTDTIGPFTANQPNAQAHITYMIGDGQSQWDSGSVNFEGHNIANNVFTGVDGPYWGTLTFDVSGLVVEPDATTTINNDNPSDPSSPDCLLWVGTVLAVQTERSVMNNILYMPLVLIQQTP